MKQESLLTCDVLVGGDICNGPLMSTYILYMRLSTWVVLIRGVVASLRTTGRETFGIVANRS